MFAVVGALGVGTASAQEPIRIGAMYPLTGGGAVYGVPAMIGHKGNVKVYPNVDLVITADGLGSADAKVSKYNKMTDNKVYPFIQFRGIKIFPPNPYEKNGHIDSPLLTFRQIYGVDPTPGKAVMGVAPDLIIIN